MKTRFKNYALWTSVIAQVALLVQLVAFLGFGLKIEDALIQGWITIGDTVLALLATLGIISNPTKPDSKGYNL